MAYKKSVQNGGTGGDIFSDDLTQTVRISAITIRSGSYVDSIQTTWLLTDGTTFTGQAHGGSGGAPTTINFASDEYITSVSGRSGKYVDQLMIVTNKESYGPYGGSGGNPFSISALNGGGFFGQSGSFLDAVGVFIPV